MKALALRNLIGDPDFSTLRTDTKINPNKGLLPVGINHTLALFDVLDMVDEGKVPGSEKMDKQGKESFKRKLAEDYIKDMGSYGFTPEAAKDIYYEAKGGHKSKTYGGKVKEGLTWNMSQGVGDSNDEMRKKSRDKLLYRNFATGNTPYNYKEGILEEPEQMTKQRQLISAYLSRQK